MGLFEDPISRNVWNYLGGPAGSVWTGYVIGGYPTQLYGYSPQRFDWVPVAADGLPTPLAKETVDGAEFWTTEVTLKQGVTWSDGEELTADDFVFTVNTVMDMQLGGNWAQLVDSAFVDRAEALDSHRLKIYFKSTDADGNPQTPGLSVWQFGLAFMPLLPEHYWAPVVEEVKGAGDHRAEQHRSTVRSRSGWRADTAGGSHVSVKWEPGRLLRERHRPQLIYSMGTVVYRITPTGRTQESNDRTRVLRHRLLWRSLAGTSSWSYDGRARTSSPRSSASTATRTRRFSP